MIIIVFGLPGSGKSYFASKLAKRLQARYVNSDVIRNQLFVVKEYSQEEKMKVYSEMVREMKKAIQQNTNIILDATFYKKSIRNKFSEVVKEYGQSIQFIEVWVDKKVSIERLSKKRQYSDANYAVHLYIKKVFETMKREHLILQSTQENIDEMLDVAVKYIQNSHGKVSNK